MTPELPVHLVRLIAAGIAALLGLTAPQAPHPVVEVPMVRTAADRLDSGGERVRKIPAPPRRERSGTLDRMPTTPDERTGSSTTDREDPDGTAPTGERTTGTRRTPDSGERTSTSDGVTAAAVHGWGTPSAEDDFSAGLGDWDLYDGPGHVGNGRRSPDAITVSGGVATITGTPDGTTGGMAWKPGQKYGRWEARVRSPAADPTYHAVLLLWPTAEDWPVGGEVDFMEISDATRQTTEMFLHYGADNSQLQGSVDVDATEWHNWAVEWTPDHIAAFVDGEEWWRTEETGTLPPGPMHMTIQLDWFPGGGDVEQSTMDVDWVRRYEV